MQSHAVPRKWGDISTDGVVQTTRCRSVGFKVPAEHIASAAAGNASILLDPAGLGRGHLHLNGADLGRYYPAFPGAASAGIGGTFFLPPSYLLEDMNVSVLGEELVAAQPPLCASYCRRWHYLMGGPTMPLAPMQTST